MKKLTREQAVVISAYTGALCCRFPDMHKYVERIMGRPVYTHEMGDETVANEIKAKAKLDFLALCCDE